MRKALSFVCVSLLFASLVLGGVILYFCQNRNAAILASSQTTAANDFQCAHWSVFRCCQLLGVPIEQNVLLRALPPATGGHSLAQVSQIFDTLGIDSKGCRDDWGTLSTVTFPCIAHLKEPDHYVVISGIEPENDYIHIFDGEGFRTRRTRAAFQEHWSGITLHLVKRDSASNPPESIRLDHLLLDKGDVPAVGIPVEFSYPFQNTGKKELVIEQVRVNCSCLEVEKPDRPVRPGEKAEIKLIYRIAPKKGPFSQSALVTTSDDTLPFFVLVACGYAGVEVRLSPQRVTLDNLCIGQECTAQCVLRYTGEWKDFRVDVQPLQMKHASLVSHDCHIAESSDWPVDQEFDSKAVGSVRKDAVRILDLTFRPIGELGDNVKGQLKITTNIKGYEEFVVDVSGEIIPPIKCYPSVLQYGNLSDTPDNLAQQVTLVASKNALFRITDVRLGDGVLSGAVFSTKPAQGKADIVFLLTRDTILKHNGGNVIVTVELEPSRQRLALPIKVVAFGRSKSN